MKCHQCNNELNQNEYVCIGTLSKDKKHFEFYYCFECVGIFAILHQNIVNIKKKSKR